MFGTGGVCEVDYIQQSCTLFGQDFDKTQLDRIGDWQEVDHPFSQSVNCVVPKGEPLGIQLGEWLQCLQGGESRLARGRELVESVELAERAIAIAEKDFRSISFSGNVWQPAQRDTQEHMS